MPLIQLTYMSSLLVYDDETISKILESARRRNFAGRVTGMLLVCEGNVVQVLEGSQNAVIDTFGRIEQDNRHTGIFKMSELRVTEREFADWSLGYRRIGDRELDAKEKFHGVFKLRSEEITTRVKPGIANLLLKTFADSQRI